MKTPLKNKRRSAPIPDIEYLEVADPEKLSKAFSLLFEEVMRRRKLSTDAKASMNT